MTGTTLGKPLLSAQNVTKNFGAQPVLMGISLTVHEFERIGLIGHNGCGKSTLLRILAGIIEPDEGFTTRLKDIRVSLLEQHCSLCTDQRVGEVLEAATSELRREISRWRELREKLSVLKPGSEAYTAVESQYLDLQHKLDATHAWDLDIEIKKIAVQLRLPPMNVQLNSLSGGELRRVDLAVKLLAHPDVLLLDEPTNHIDTDSVAWIEQFLETYCGACILVTHDRYFLDRIANRIVEITHGTLMSFPGNYERFLEYKANVEEVQARTEANRQSLIKREWAWYRRSPQARGTKAKARIQRLFDAQAQSPPPASKQFSFAIPEPERLGKDILEAKLITHGYENRVLFRHFSIVMQKGMRVGIIGPNGCGKSTLLRILMGYEIPNGGEIRIGKSTHFLYVDQTLSDMDPQMRVLEFVSEGQRHIEIGKQRIYIPAYLESFLFDKSCLDMPLGRLSGGERRRIDLAKKLLKGGNFLVLDEPTNDLDLYTLRVLEETIESFDGCALIVSHDRYLLNRLCTHMLVFEEEGTLTKITGNYNDYLLYCERKKEEDKTSRQQQKNDKVARSGQALKSRPGLSYKEKQELTSIESFIEEAEREVDRIRLEINRPGFYDQPFTTTQHVLHQLEEAELKVKWLYARWEMLEQKANAGSTDKRTLGTTKES